MSQSPLNNGAIYSQLVEFCLLKIKQKSQSPLNNGAIYSGIAKSAPGGITEIVSIPSE